MTELEELAENIQQRFPGLWPMTYAQARALASLLMINEDSQTLIDGLTDALLELNP